LSPTLKKRWWRKPLRPAEVAAVETAAVVEAGVAAAAHSRRVAHP
jgi:hypothetical protein